LSSQANGATLGHAQALGPLSPAVNESVVNFEANLFNAQIQGAQGMLTAEKGRGGPEALASQTFVAGRFDLYDAWATSGTATRRAIYRGQEVFNTRGDLTNGRTCLSCHNVQNVGTNLSGRHFSIGVAAAAIRTPDMPLYTLVNKTTGETIQTTDPGRALITGLWRDIGLFKTPSVRGLAARAPYFHDGSAKTLRDVVTYYDDQLNYGFTAQEADDLVAFLAAL
jgi:cytochrome c peroxidase